MGMACGAILFNKTGTKPVLELEAWLKSHHVVYQITTYWAAEASSSSTLSSPSCSSPTLTFTRSVGEDQEGEENVEEEETSDAQEVCQV